MQWLPPRLVLLALGLVLASGSRAVTQEKTRQKTVEQKQKELETRVKNLEKALEDLKDENVDLTEEIEDLNLEQSEVKPEPVRLNLLNPQITVFGNMAGRFDSKPVFSMSGETIDNKLFFRTGEVDFRSAIDPFADAVAIMSFENDASGGFEADVEEAYFVLKKFPGLDSAPLGLKLKMGAFRPAFGSVNKLHLHDLPWTTRPLAIVKYLGSEEGGFFEAGFNPVGIDADMILPEFIPGTVQEVNLDVVNGGDTGLDDNNSNPAFLGHYNMFIPINGEHDITLGLSAYEENSGSSVALYGLDFLYKWKPFEQGESRSFVLGGEAFFADTKRNSPFGAFLYAQSQLTWNAYAGVRYDYAQEVLNDHLATHIGGAYLSYYTSEFLRFRVGYEHRMSDLSSEDGLNTVFLEANFVFGSHPTEPYWVNR